MTDFALTPAIDEGARVADSDLSIRLYLSLKREVHWIPDLYRNAYLAIASQDDRAFFMSALTEQVFTHRAGRVQIIDAVGDASILDPRRGDYHSMELADAGKTVIEAAGTSKAIREACRSAGILAPHARYFDVLVLRVTRDQLDRMCQVAPISEALVELAQNGMDSRTPLVVLTDEASRKHLPVLREVNWAAYMGDDNVEFAKGLYKNLADGVFNPGRIKLGVLAAFDRAYLSVLQPLIYAPSSWGDMKKTRQKAEKRVYEDFLEGLRNDDDR